MFVAFFVTLLVGDRLLADYWVSAGMSAAGIALLNLGGSARAARAAATGTSLLTVVASLAAAACYAMFDVLRPQVAPAWGVGRLLPAVMGWPP